MMAGCTKAIQLKGKILQKRLRKYYTWNGPPLQKFLPRQIRDNRGGYKISQI